MKTRSRSVIGVLALAMAAGSAMFLAACASDPSYIEPTRQPGGIVTPGIRFYPPSGGESTLPAGFQPCGQFTAKVTMEDGSTLTLSGCLYCATDPRDPTVYVQHNCTGDYKKGIRNDYVVLVGGAPLNESFAESIGADAYLPDAAAAADAALSFVAQAA